MAPCLHISAVDATGDVLIAGATAAPGYPTTPDSYQPNYTAASKTVLTCGPPIPMEVTSPSGYVTLVKADGSGLIFSTFFSGSKSDSVSFAALTSAGIYLGGQGRFRRFAWVRWHSAVSVPPSRLRDPNGAGWIGHFVNSHAAGNSLAYDSTTGTLLLVSGSDLLRFDPSTATPIACLLDAADSNPVTSVAPGELLAMYRAFPILREQPVWRSQ